jgi:hypothetical protein
LTKCIIDILKKFQDRDIKLIADGKKKLNDKIHSFELKKRRLENFKNKIDVTQDPNRFIKPTFASTNKIISESEVDELLENKKSTYAHNSVITIAPTNLKIPLKAKSFWLPKEAL